MAEVVEDLPTEAEEPPGFEQATATMLEQDQQADAEGEAETESQPDVHEKRIHQRFRVSLRVYIRLSDGDITQAQAVDLSMGGVYIEYASSAEVNKEFEMAFDLPFNDSFERVFVKAKVVRSIVIGSRNLYGLAFIFTEFGKDTEKVLSHYIQIRHRQSA